jgi:hypothetical protein
LSPEERAATVAALADAFGTVTDVTPADEQPLHVLFGELSLPGPWTSPTRGLARFTNWPHERPEFFIDVSVVNDAGTEPRSNSIQTVLGGGWRQYSFSFPWSEDGADPVRVILLWLTRFSEPT